MPCFCKNAATHLTTQAVSIRATVMAVPPQMPNLASLLGLQKATANASLSASARADMIMAAKIPNVSYQSWLSGKLGVYIPSPIPVGGGGALNMAVRLSAAANVFPLTDPRRLYGELKQAAASLAKQFMPKAYAGMGALYTPNFSAMVLAARMTLTLRAQGICPMALAAGVKANAKLNLAASATMSVAMAQSALESANRHSLVLQKTKMPAFALTPDQMNLAMNLSALAEAQKAQHSLSLPATSDPNFMKTLNTWLESLARIPALPIPTSELLALASKLEELSVVTQAFGPDAMTPAGVARVNAMLSYVASLKLPPPPSAAMALQALLEKLPDLDMVMDGARSVNSSPSTLQASMSAKAPVVPIAPAIEALNALISALQRSIPNLKDCGACAFPIKDFMPAMPSSA